jgi:hypothetical protein
MDRGKPRLEITMNITSNVRDSRANDYVTAPAVVVSYWATEFERVYLLAAARIRGQRTPRGRTRS